MTASTNTSATIMDRARVGTCSLYCTNFTIGYIRYASSQATKNGRSTLLRKFIVYNTPPTRSTIPSIRTKRSKVISFSNISFYTFFYYYKSHHCFISGELHLNLCNWPDTTMRPAQNQRPCSSLSFTMRW